MHFYFSKFVFFMNRTLFHIKAVILFLLTFPFVVFLYSKQSKPFMANNMLKMIILPAQLITICL